MPDSKSAKPDAINLVAFSSRPEKEGTKYDGPWMHPVTQAALLDEFCDWEPEVNNLLKVSLFNCTIWYPLVQTALKLVKNPTLWAIHAVPAISSYSQGNVCILGDAVR